ncbi:DUF5305 domain-containing protein [Salinarchaeum sp. IM2453]|uniref:DUF5305 family protein n=1 Tax=Salinarchaeum sp. IM2453 TaxID=2862870 RepID=UPI001C834AC3|nr:DUF5305 family protein [Salinarchaeum sp. IM2453]QZA88489.1 DUF5305 domain-containing protein [Salinarchaeum sp. IM2453]
MSEEAPPMWKLRMKSVIDQWFLPIVVICLLLVAAGGFLVYTGVADPGESEEQEVVASAQYDSSFDYSVVVDEDVEIEGETVFRAGERQPSGQSFYLRDVGTTVEGSLDINTDANEFENFSLAQDPEVVVSLEGTSDGQQIWDVKSEIEDHTTEVGDDEASIEFEFDVTDIEDRISDAEGAVGGAVDVEAEVLVSTTVAGSLDGEERFVEETGSIDVDIGTTTFELDADHEVSPEPGVTANPGQIQIVELTTTTESPSYIQGMLGVLLIVGGLGGIGIAGISFRTMDLPPSKEEQSWLEYQSDRDEFDEWITQIELSETDREHPTAEAETLADLVDFAIDTNNSVMYDPADETYSVVHDETRYVFTPPEPPEDPALFGQFAVSAPGSENGDSESEEEVESKSSEDPGS